MIEYTRHILSNGLVVLLHEDDSTPMAVVNVLYNVGARDESPEKTGFAHLFEHLMFGGSRHAPDFDDPIQMAGGENNAFTNNDITNFYNVMPAENLETALWLESDRMQFLNFDPKVLDVQKKVVIEEFKESCLNQPYGDVWHHISEMAYKVHPYRWPTIGKVPEHVAGATMEDVEEFYGRFYKPNNAVVVITGNINTEEALSQVEKWFGDIPAGDPIVRNLPAEPVQKRFEKRVQHANVPVDALYLAFHAPSRVDYDFYVADLLSDMLCNGASSRLYSELLKKKQLFSQIDCYLSGSIDPGLFVIEGKPSEGVSLEQAEDAIWKELDYLLNHVVSADELQKWKNKMESTLIFSEGNPMNKAMNLAFFEAVGDVDLINREADLYQQITPEDIQRVARQILNPENCCEVYYKVNSTP